MKKRLRHGFTTGSAAAAAAKAALLLLLGRKAGPGPIDIPLPEKGRLLVPVESVRVSGGYARAVVVKDGGDDPDATHGARISCSVRLVPGSRGRCGVIIKGGPGVGRVTRPGLPVPPGEPAINPGPRKQLQKVVAESFRETGMQPCGIEITIEVEDGEKIAGKTLNPRLGIVGGISILGTRGTVVPFSHSSYKDTITLQMDAARAQGAKTIVLCTGGRSERFARRINPGLDDSLFIQVADFFSFSLKQAVKKGFGQVIYSCFFGKLVKMAQGHAYTHARKCSIDFSVLEQWCLHAGMTPREADAVRKANTAHHVLEIITASALQRYLFAFIMRKALESARFFSGPGPDIQFCLFSMQGDLLALMKDKGDRS